MKKLIAVLFVCVLAGCQTTRELYTSDDEFKRRPGEAVVLIGVIGDRVGQELFAVDEKGRPQRFFIPAFALHPNRVFALSYPANETFKFTRMKVPQDITRTRVYSFDNAPEVRITEEAIYPYGVLIVNDKGGKVSMSAKFPDAFMKAAQKTYPSIFKALPVKK